MSDPYTIWALVLLGVALILFVIELFVPSAGILAFCAAVCAVASIVCWFKVNTTLGLLASLLMMLAIPIGTLYGMKILPETPIWKWLTLKDPQRTAALGGGATVDPDDAPPADRDAAPARLVGVTGKAITDLRPIGVCLINGKRTDCLADGQMIEAGTAVRVVFADGMQIKVRADE